MQYITGSAPGTKNFNLAAHQKHANNSDRSPTSFKSRINLSAMGKACCDEKTNVNADSRTGGGPTTVSTFIPARIPSSECTANAFRPPSLSAL